MSGVKGCLPVVFIIDLSLAALANSLMVLLIKALYKGVDIYYW
jgi:hypothetical protein